MSKIAVINTGGKQYKVAEGDTLRVEKLDLEPGSKVKLDTFLIFDKISTVLSFEPLSTTIISCPGRYLFIVSRHFLVILAVFQVGIIKETSR